MSGYTVSPSTAALANHFFETLGCTEPQRRRFLQLEGAYERVRNLHGEAWAKAQFVEHWRTQEMARSDGVTIAMHDAVQAHLARAASGETITDTCPNLNMGSTALSNSIPISSTHTMSNSEPESGLQTDATWKSNLDPTFAVLGTNSTPTPITTSNSISTATPTLIHNPRSGPGLKPGLASRPAHQAPIVSLPGTSAFVSSSTGAKSSFDPPASRLLVRSDVAAEIGDTGMGMDAEMDGQREVDQGQGRDPEEVRRQRQDELRLQEEDQVQRQDGRQREDEVEHQREDRIQSEVTSTRTSGKVAGRGAEQKERELRSQPQSQKECEQVRVNGIQGREGEMVAEQDRLAPSPSAITVTDTPVGSGPTYTVTVIERTQTQMEMNSSGTGQEVPGTTRLEPMHREATQLDLASVSPRRLLLSDQRLPARLSPTYLDPLPNRSPIFATAGTVSASAPAAQIAVERNEPVVVRSCVREAKLKEQYKAVGPLDLEMATSPPGIALATVSSNAETSVEAVSPRPEHNETSTARDSSLHPSTPNHYEPQNSRGGGKDNVEKHQKVTRTTLYLDEGESLIYRVGQRGISNEYLSGILRPNPDWKSWTSTSGKVKRHFYAEMVFQFKLSRDLARAQAGMRDGDGIRVKERDESTDRSIDDDGMWDEDELRPAEECGKDLSDLVF